MSAGRAGALLLGAVGVALPAEGLARALAGVEAPHLGSVMTGAWIFKILLLFHGVFLWGATAPRPPGTVPPGRPRDTFADGDHPVPGDPGGNEEGRPGTAGGAVGYWVLAGLLALGLGVRLVGLGEGLWFDEIKTWVRYVDLPLGRIVTTFDDQNQHVLYSVAAKVTWLVLGPGPVALRLPAVLFGVGGLWALWWLARGLVGRLEALVATAILAVSYHHVWFSQNARGYTGLLFFTLVATGLFLQLVREGEAGRWGLPAAYAASMALALYTHMTAGVLFVAHAAILLALVAAPDRALRGAGLPRPAPVPAFAGLALAGTLSLQLYALVLPRVAEVLLAPSLSGVAIEWKSPAWLVRETLGGLAAAVPAGAVGLAAVGILLASGAASYARRDALALLTMTVPAAITAGAILGLGHNLWPRFFFFSAGFAVLILVRGLFAASAAVARRVSRAPGRAGPRWATAVGALLALASVATVPRAWAAKQDFGAALEYVEDVARVDDAVVLVDMTILPYRELWERDWPVVRDVRQLSEIERSSARTWLIYTFPTSFEAVEPDVWARVRDEYREAARFAGTVAGGDVIVMVNR